MLLANKSRRKKERVSENQLNLFDLMMESTEMVVSEVQAVVDKVKNVISDVSSICPDLEELDALLTVSEEETLPLEELEVLIPKQVTEPKNFSYVVVNGDIFYHENEEFIPQHLTGRRADRLKGMIELHELVREMLACQQESVIEAYSTEQFQAHYQRLLQHLNRRYDAFVSDFGYLNHKTNANLFMSDAGAPLLQSLEVEHPTEKNVYEKGAFFVKPTVQRFKEPTEATSPDEALQLSLNLKGHVNLTYMCELYSAFKGTMVSKEELLANLSTPLYLNPKTLEETQDENLSWEIADEYLSGFVKEKLREAEKAALTNPRFERNVEALRLSQPNPLSPDEISFILGSTWIPIEYYNQFLHELFQISRAYETDIVVQYSNETNTYNVTGKNYLSHTVLVSQTYGTRRLSGLKIFEDTLNLKSVEVKDRVTALNEEGREVERYVLNQQETILAREKQALIKTAFENWLFQDGSRSECLTTLYNDRFNTIRPRQFDGSRLIFPGMNPDITLEEHQRNVIAHGIYGSGNLLIAQEVGAGKTYSAIAIGHELKRLGVVNKPLYAVPNHLVGQWAREYLTLYPNAELLVGTTKAFEKKNRAQFIGRMATGSYDAIILPQSSFESIQMSPSYQKQVLTDELAEVQQAFANSRENNGYYSFSTRQLAGLIKKLEEQLKSLDEKELKQEGLYFEDLGVDCLIVDEAHAYKNNFTQTKLRNVAGVGTTRSQRAVDVFMKVQYINEKMNGRGVVYLTGTPVSNSMSELHVLQKTLQPEILKEKGLFAFDAWASTFGRIESSLEIKPEGNGYQLKQRFARFHNLPELMNLFSLIADIKTSDMLNLPTPNLKGGQPIIIKTKITPEQQAIVESHGERAEDIRNGRVDSSEDNFLKLTMEARLNAIDPRILDESLPNNEHTKLNVCAKEVAKIYRKTMEKKSTQIIFCDQGISKKGHFNFYDAIKQTLIGLGVHEEDIAFIHEAKTDIQRSALFDKVVRGDIRILLGSTSKMGTGVNVQDRLIAVHHLDIPWRPSDLTQRNGRILRRGNQNKEVMIFNYITEDTFDSYLWQILEQKQRYIGQIMTGRSALRTCEDLDDTTLQYAEFKALAIADPRIKRKMEVDNEYNRLTLLQSMWKRDQSHLQDKIQNTLPQKISETTQFIAHLERDLETYNSVVPKSTETNATKVNVIEENLAQRMFVEGFLAEEPVTDENFTIQIGNHHYKDRDVANQALKVLMAKSSLDVPYGVHKPLGTYLGFEFGLCRPSSLGFVELYLKGSSIYHTRFVQTRVLAQLDALGRSFNQQLEQARFRLTETQRELKKAKQQIKQPFAYTEILREVKEEKMKLDLELEFAQ